MAHNDSADWKMQYNGSFDYNNVDEAGSVFRYEYADNNCQYKKSGKLTNNGQL
jgi:hypothetical protein